MKGESAGVGTSHRLIYALAGDRVARARGIPYEDDPSGLAPIDREVDAQRGSAWLAYRLEGPKLRAAMLLKRAQERVEQIGDGTRSRHTSRGHIPDSDVCYVLGNGEHPSVASK